MSRQMAVSAVQPASPPHLTLLLRGQISERCLNSTAMKLTAVFRQVLHH